MREAKVPFSSYVLILHFMKANELISLPMNLMSEYLYISVQVWSEHHLYQNHLGSFKYADFARVKNNELDA